MEREPDGTLITLVDEEDGTEKEFEFIASLEHDGFTYVALVPAFMEPEEFIESDAELVILKVIKDENGEDIFSTIDDDDEFDTVAAEFENMLANEYDIMDEEDLEDDDNSDEE